MWLVLRELDRTMLVCFVWTEPFLFRSIAFVGVMVEGSMRGDGLWKEDFLGSVLTNEVHCLGRPINCWLSESNPVCTLWMKFEGAEISTFFFRLINDIIKYQKREGSVSPVFTLALVWCKSKQLLVCHPSDICQALVCLMMISFYLSPIHGVAYRASLDWPLLLMHGKTYNQHTVNNLDLEFFSSIKGSDITLA